MATDPSPSSAAPFTGDCEFIDAEIRFLKVRASRIVAQQEHRARQQAEEGEDARPGRYSVRDLRCRAHDLEVREEELRAAIDARLAATRADTSRPKLGLDRLCQSHRLDSQERMIALAVCIPAISPHLAEVTFSEIGNVFRSMSYGDIARLLDLTGSAAWVNARHYLDADSPLVAGNIVTIQPVPGPQAPDSIWYADITITEYGFQTITGDKS